LVQALAELRRSLHGGSFGLAIAPTRSADGGALLISAPQLGYSYPLLLVEYEIHGAGYDARGSSVPILPVVGIGYTEHAAWALTTGYSKTIDSFILQLCSSAQQAAGSCARNQYFHNGEWKDLSCRSETIPYRAAVSGVPVGPAEFSVEAEVCRSVQGPVVARDEAAGLARVLSYAMFGREIETIEGIREWNRAKSFAEFHAAMEKVTWNENTVVATRDGHIAYYHPGLHPRRHPQTDQRLPIPGTGEFDHAGLLSFAQTPQVVDPAQGYVANWNNKPAYGWLDGDGFGSTSRPGGPGQRVTNLLELLDSRRDWRYEDLVEIDRLAGTLDPRAREYRPVMARLPREGLSELERAALERVLAWEGAHYAADIDIEDEGARDSVGATLFDLWVRALREELFAPLRQIELAPGFTAFDRISGVGSHVFDQSVMDNLALRVLDPAHSGLALRHDFAQGRSAAELLQAALRQALATAAAQFNEGAALTVADLERVRRIHPRSQICSLTGVIGPGSDTVPGTACVTMPYQDRGSWVHRVGYPGPAAR
ncbi:MAG TPA: penicillin acylase family protein, partial [Nevskiaceae bacterium]|nr:penicillin acylase family protein [Nevskiaceae bacterium]